MPKEYNCAQGEWDWMKIRAGKVTASEMDNILTPKLAIKDSKALRNYAFKKAEEALTGPLPQISSMATDHGAELELEAFNWCSMEFYGEGMRTVGFIEHDDGRCGCSPDALIGDEGGLELKCPVRGSGKHAQYYCEGVLPDAYAPQVHMSLYVTGRKWWRFVSYSRKMKKFVVTVHRDEQICATIAEALDGFYKRLDAAMKQLAA